MKTAKTSFQPTGAKAAGLLGKMQTVGTIIGEGRSREMLALIGERWISEIHSFGLRRDLNIPFAAPEAAIPITVRPLRAEDIPQLMGIDDPTLDDAAREERTSRRQMVDANIGTCYVAVTEDGTPCYMQWLIGASDNDKVQEYFKGSFPILRPDEALLENAFTPEKFRGKRIMPAAMAQIAEKGADFGARYVITFVTHDNVPSLKGCKRSGFMPYLTRLDRWSMFRHSISFAPLPANTPYPFDQEKVEQA